MANKKLYPLGVQTFEKLRIEGCFYVDKTKYVYDLTHSSSNYVFLSRPRRFGKSLLISTLKSYFEGRRDLFDGLAIADLEKEWTAYPVLLFSMASSKHQGKEEMQRYLHDQLAQQEKYYGIETPAIDANIRLKHLIQRAYKQTGRQVVVLIDEYDAPLLDVVHEDEQLPVLRNIMRNFYSPLKDCDPYLRFVFLTGITKFSQLSIFSELNNITNISMDDEYAAICGITKDEMLTLMTDDIAELAQKNKMTEEETVKELTMMYDGYHFSPESPDIFNPYSLLSCFAKKRINSYWFGSGTPTYLIEMMKKFGFQPSQLCKTEATVDDFDVPTQSMTNVIPLLYQSGYMTIKGYDDLLQCYTLDVPNNEVRIGLVKALVPYYVMPDTMPTNNAIVNMMRFLLRDDIDGALRLLQTFLSTVPYCDNTNYEGHWQQVLFIIFSLLGNYCDVEVHTSTGRVDMVMATKTRLYLIETKLNKDADAALQQMELKEYDKRFALYTLPRVKVGINFDAEKHTLSDWKIEE